ncbi:MAG: DUF4351 domain-containing protein [Cyanobacteria bacterium P01_A01_bin.17]
MLDIRLQETRLYQEVKEEGRQEGRQEGEASLVLRQLRRRVGPLASEVEEQISELPLPLLEDLGEGYPPHPVSLWNACSDDAHHLFPVPFSTHRCLQSGSGPSLSQSPSLSPLLLFHNPCIPETGDSLSLSSE